MNLNLEKRLRITFPEPQYGHDGDWEDIVEAARIGADFEREACAAVCDEYAKSPNRSGSCWSASAIRARGKP